MKKLLQVLIALFLAVFAIMIFAPKALAFCGFYVAKADTRLYNQASQVIIARDGDRTILTMANDYQGDVKDFALVVPVPVYRIPRGATRLLQPYIRQNMKFFVAKVNLKEFESGGSQLLRPLQIAYESPRFMLPIRLGMINATNEQDLIVYILSPNGQAEVTNYRTVQIPSNVGLPLFVKDEFDQFYKAMFQTAYEQEQKKVAFLEYAWDMGWCDPCAANPLTRQELGQAGVFWLDTNAANNVFISRFHVRYTRDTFPEDLMFQETGSRQNFQGRYVLRHPYTGEMNCPAADEYKRTLNQRFEQEAQTLAKLTGWQIGDIRRKMDIPGTKPSRWWRRIWN